MYGFLTRTNYQVMTLSFAQVADIQDELYSIQAAVRDNPMLHAKVQKLIRKFDVRPEREMQEQSTTRVVDDEELDDLVSKLMFQARQQCQQ